MNSRLLEVKNWECLAQDANYSAGVLAKGCRISVRQLERFFVETTGESPQHWLNRLRHERALKWLQEGCSVKETALGLRYKSIAHFSREFKREHGFPPSHLRLRQIQLPPG